MPRLHRQWELGWHYDCQPLNALVSKVPVLNLYEILFDHLLWSLLTITYGLIIYLLHSTSCAPVSCTSPSSTPQLCLPNQSKSLLSWILCKIKKTQMEIQNPTTMFLHEDIAAVQHVDVSHGPCHSSWSSSSQHSLVHGSQWRILRSIRHVPCIQQSGVSLKIPKLQDGIWHLFISTCPQRHCDQVPRNTLWWKLYGGEQVS